MNTGLLIKWPLATEDRDAQLLIVARDGAREIRLQILCTRNRWPRQDTGRTDSGQDGSSLAPTPLRAPPGGTGRPGQLRARKTLVKTRNGGVLLALSVVLGLARKPAYLTDLDFNRK
jgi:hypothetical protein